MVRATAAKPSAEAGLICSTATLVNGGAHEEEEEPERGQGSHARDQQPHAAEHLEHADQHAQRLAGSDVVEQVDHERICGELEHPSARDGKAQETLGHPGCDVGGSAQLAVVSLSAGPMLVVV